VRSTIFVFKVLSTSIQIFGANCRCFRPANLPRGYRGSRLCGEDRDRETENSKVCARTRDTRFIQVQAAKVASPTSCLGIKYGALRLGLG
jgi:hypothetical protein